MAFISVNIEELKRLIVLSRVDNNLVGDQIRKAVGKYLESRKDEIDNEIEVMRKEGISIVDALIGKDEAE